LAAAGQTTSGPAYISQQFYLGIAFGCGSGRAELSGDNGLAASAELRFDQKTGYQYLSGYQSTPSSIAAWRGIPGIK
jgi:hemolysin activation/secretion protein